MLCSSSSLIWMALHPIENIISKHSKCPDMNYNTIVNLQYMAPWCTTVAWGHITPCTMNLERRPSLTICVCTRSIGNVCTHVSVSGNTWNWGLKYFLAGKFVIQLGGLIPAYPTSFVLCASYTTCIGYHLWSNSATWWSHMCIIAVGPISILIPVTPINSYIPHVTSSVDLLLCLQVFCLRWSIYRILCVYVCTSGMMNIHV